MRAAELYQEHAPFVGRLCRSLLRDAGEAEDASQQTFLAAYRAILNGTEPREPAAWLATIARNECIARVRGRMREPLPSDVEPSEVAPDAHVEAVRNEHRSELAEALATLPAQQREAVLLRDVRGFSYEEVAASLAVSTSAVESLLFRARSRLRSQLRTAYAAFSGAGWLGPLRELLGSGGIAGAPVAAKAVAVGALGAAVAGGVVAPTMLEHRPHSSPPPPLGPAAHTQPAPEARQAAVPPVVFSLPRPSRSDRPLVENTSAVSARPGDGRERDGAAGGGDGATGERQGGDGSSSEPQGGGVPAGGESDGSGGESRTQSGGSGESDRATTSPSPSSEESSPSQTVPAPVERSSAGLAAPDGSGDASGQPSGQTSGASSGLQPDQTSGASSSSSGASDSGGGDGSDGGDGSGD